jgi:hypothetical protein
MHGTDIGVPESAVPGDTASAPGSSGATGPGVSGLFLSGSPGFLPPPINWRWVGDEVEFECSQVTTVERMLHEMLVSVDQNILHPIQVSLKKRGKSCPPALAPSMLFRLLLYFVSAAFVLA